MITREMMKELFYIDGSLRDIYILDTLIVDWDNLINFIESGNWLIEFIRNNDIYSKIPYTAQQIFQFRASGDYIHLSISIRGVKVNCYFFEENQIELDIDPKEVQSLESGQQIIDFVCKLSKVLHKESSLTPENCPEDPLVIFKSRDDQVIYCYAGDEYWFCPAIEKVIPHGLCWEYYFAGRGGPADTEDDLISWLVQSKKFDNLESFEEECKRCPYNQG